MTINTKTLSELNALVSKLSDEASQIYFNMLSTSSFKRQEKLAREYGRAQAK